MSGPRVRAGFTDAGDRAGEQAEQRHRGPDRDGRVVPDAAAASRGCSLTVACRLEDFEGVDECRTVLFDDAVADDSEGDIRVVDIREPGHRRYGALDGERPGDAEIDRGREVLEEAEHVACAEISLPLH